MADSKQQKHETTKPSPKADREGELSEKDWEKASGGSISSGGDRSTES